MKPPPPDSYLAAHMARTIEFLRKRGMYTPPPKDDLPSDIRQFLEGMK